MDFCFTHLFEAPRALCSLSLKALTCCIVLSCTYEHLCSPHRRAVTPFISRQPWALQTCESLNILCKAYWMCSPLQITDSSLSKKNKNMKGPPCARTYTDTPDPHCTKKTRGLRVFQSEWLSAAARCNVRKKLKGLKDGETRWQPWSGFVFSAHKNLGPDQCNYRARGKAWTCPCEI